MDDRIASVACSFRVAQYLDGPSGPAVVTAIEIGGSPSASQSITSLATAEETTEYCTFNSSGQYVDYAAHQLLHKHRKVRRQIHLVQYSL